MGSPNKKRRGKKDENSVLLAKKMWWHMPKKESSKLSNSPPPEKVPEQSEKRLKRVLDSFNQRLNSKKSVIRSNTDGDK